MSDTATGIECILDLIQLAAGASQDRRSTELCLERAGNGRISIGLAGAWRDAGICKPLRVLASESGLEVPNTYLVRGQILEQGDGCIQEINELVLRLIVGVAARVQC